MTKQDIAVSRVSRAHARRLRDNLLKTKAVSTARRNINDVKSVLSLVIREYDLNINNPFTRLEFPKPNDAAVELRASLPTDVIVSMYGELSQNQTLHDIWTLLHHSGAQSAEVLGLTVDDLQLTDPIPYFEVKPLGLRTVKDRSRIRKIPLVGKAFDVAMRLAVETAPGKQLFPQYADTLNSPT